MVNDFRSARPISAPGRAQQPSAVCGGQEPTARTGNPLNGREVSQPAPPPYLLGTTCVYCALVCSPDAYHLTRTPEQERSECYARQVWLKDQREREIQEAISAPGSTEEATRLLADLDLSLDANDFIREHVTYDIERKDGNSKYRAPDLWMNYHKNVPRNARTDLKCAHLAPEFVENQRVQSPGPVGAPPRTAGFEFGQLQWVDRTNPGVLRSINSTRVEQELADLQVHSQPHADVAPFASSIDHADEIQLPFGCYASKRRDSGCTFSNDDTQSEACSELSIGLSTYRTLIDSGAFDDDQELNACSSDSSDCSDDTDEEDEVDVEGGEEQDLLEPGAFVLEYNDKSYSVVKFENTKSFARRIETMVNYHGLDGLCRILAGIREKTHFDCKDTSCRAPKTGDARRLMRIEAGSSAFPIDVFLPLAAVHSISRWLAHMHFGFPQSDAQESSAYVVQDAENLLRLFEEHSASFRRSTIEEYALDSEEPGDIDEEGNAGSDRSADGDSDLERSGDHGSDLDHSTDDSISSDDSVWSVSSDDTDDSYHIVDTDDPATSGEVEHSDLCEDRPCNRCMLRQLPFDRPPANPSLQVLIPHSMYQAMLASGELNPRELETAVDDWSEDDNVFDEEVPRAIHNDNQRIGPPPPYTRFDPVAQHEQRISVLHTLLSIGNEWDLRLPRDHPILDRLHDQMKHAWEAIDSALTSAAYDDDLPEYEEEYYHPPSYVHAIPAAQLNDR